MPKGCCCETARRAVRDPLYRHRRVQAHQRYAGASDRRRVPEGRGGAAAPVGRARRFHRAARRRRVRHPAARHRLRPRMSRRWSRGSIRRCARRSIATAISLSSDASIGIAIAPRDGSDLFDLLKNADLAMYAAKAAGRRTYRFFDPAMEQQANHRRELEADLRAALAEGGFELHYQPLVDLRSDRGHRLRGAAALAASGARHGLAGRLRSGRRGNRPDRGDRAVGAAHRLRGSGDLAGRMSASPSTSRRSSSGRKRCR